MLPSNAHGLVRAEEGIGGGVPAAAGQQKPPEATRPGNAKPCTLSFGRSRPMRAKTPKNSKKWPHGIYEIPKRLAT